MIEKYVKTIKRELIITLIIFSAFTISYICIGFYLWNFNPANWTLEDRIDVIKNVGGSVLILLILSGFFGGLFLLNR